MERIFPITALTKQQDSVKKAAQQDIVRITERGAGAWIFASEEAFNRRVDAAVANALYEAGVASVVARGMHDYEQGRYTVGTDEAKAELAKMKARK